VQLNPIIRGWAHYHRHVVSKQTFRRVDSEIFLAVWQWAKRRHQKRSRAWIRRKYFDASPRYKWRLSGLLTEGRVKPQRVWLLRASKIAIQRHTKVRALANPYDPEWEPYFEKRIDSKTLRDLRGKERLRRLWFLQRGICPVCRQKITKQSGWHSHHLVWRVHGGGDGIENRVLLHPNCHQQVHSLGLEVEKLRLAKGVREA
jgi:RNA-directed DNA polymerase